MSLRGRLLLWLAVLVGAAAAALVVPLGSNGDGVQEERLRSEDRPRPAVGNASEAKQEARMVDSAPPERLVVRAVAEYPHDVEAFTQGLLWHDGALYESTGLYGRSTVRRVDLTSGKVEQRRALEAMFFGEGLTLVGERFYLLTWRSGIGMVLDRRSFEEVSRFTYEGEGWGLCYDGSRLVMSNGSSRLAFYDPAGFTFLGEVEVRLAGKSQAGLNELECAGGQVYANIFGADSIVRIDPRDGRINAVIDAGGLLDPTARHAAGVLNGIAHRPESDTFLITGKNWPKVFEVAFEQ